MLDKQHMPPPQSVTSNLRSIRLGTDLLNSASTGFSWAYPYGANWQPDCNGLTFGLPSANFSLTLNSNTPNARTTHLGAMCMEAQTLQIQNNRGYVCVDASHEQAHAVYCSTLHVLHRGCVSAFWPRAQRIEVSGNRSVSIYMEHDRDRALFPTNITVCCVLQVYLLCAALHHACTSHHQVGFTSWGVRGVPNAQGTRLRVFFPTADDGTTEPTTHVSGRLPFRVLPSLNAVLIFGYEGFAYAFEMDKQPTHSTNTTTPSQLQA